MMLRNKAGWFLGGVAVSFVMLGLGCTETAPDPGTTSDENTLINDPLNNEGTLSGKIAGNSSTRESLTEAEAAQEVPVSFDTAATSVRFFDFTGNELREPGGEPIPPVEVGEDGSFTAENLPVGADFVVCGDIGNDGTCELEQIVNIPADDTGTRGALDHVEVNPLAKLIISKLREILAEQGLELRDLPVSPTAIAARIITAYKNLFDETGIDTNITLEDISSLDLDELAELFDTLVPDIVQLGMQIVEGNAKAARAGDDAEKVALAVAEVFLKAGFPIADSPGGPDFSLLGEFEGVIVTTPDALRRGPDRGPDLEDIKDVLANLPEGLPIDLSQLPGDIEEFPGEFVDSLPDDIRDRFPEELLEDLSPELLAGLLGQIGEGGVPVNTIDGGLNNLIGQRLPGDSTLIYVNTVAEPDRNFANAEDRGSDEANLPPLPVLSDHMLTRMAQMHLNGGRITLGDLYDLLTSIDDGLGARLTYFVEDPNFFGPPLTVFETEDGRGKSIRLEDVFGRLVAAGLENLGPEQFDDRENALRSLLGELLNDTLPPVFERLFNAIVTDRITSVDDLANRIRGARAHLPFNNSGPRGFFVVADGDAFRGGETVNAVTVDADVKRDGTVTSVTYNSSGTGKFYLGVTERTDELGIVRLIVRETGKPLQSRQGQVRLSLSNESIFQPVGGLPFSDFVSETGVFYRGVSIGVTPRFEPPPSGPGPLDGNGLGGSLDGGIINDQPDPVTVDPLDVGVTDGSLGDGVVEDPSIDEPTDVPDITENQFDGEIVGDDPVMTGGEPVGDMGDTTGGDPNAGPGDSASGEHRVFVLALGEDDGDAAALKVDYDFVTGVATYNPNGRNLLMFLPDSQETGLFALFNEAAGRPAQPGDPSDFFQGPIMRPDGFDDFFNNNQDLGDHLGDFENVDDFVSDFFGEDPSRDPIDGPPPPSGPDGPVDGNGDPDNPPPPPPGGIDDPNNPDGPVDNPDGGDPNTEGDGSNGEDPEPPAGAPVPGEPPNPQDFILVDAATIVGVDLTPRTFTHVFGTEVENPRYKADADPYYDDINNNGVHDPDEPTSPHRPLLFDAKDWRATDIALYYRRMDNSQPVDFEDVAFESETPKTRDGVALVSRSYRPRLNAFRFGRPNTAVNLLTAFAPPTFFDGTRTFNRETPVDIFQAISLINLVMDQVLNVEADMDVDGIGPLERKRELVNASIFVAPIGDPFLLLTQGFRDRATFNQPSP